MIGKLTGLVDSFGPDHLLLDVAGVGYLVHVSPRTIAALPRAGEKTSLIIEMQVREDAIRLYGFVSDNDRDWFRLLQNVQGVGAKVALAILGVLTTAELSTAIARDDKISVARSPGVGPKLAARIVAELKDKMPESTGDVAGAIGSAAPLPRSGEDAISALVNLGYGRPQAATVIAQAVSTLGESAATAALIRQGLKLLSQ